MASGINEHNEARRREMTFLRKAWVEQKQQRAYAEKVSQNENELAMLSQGQRPPSTYDSQVNALRGHTATSQYRDTDSARREALRRQQEVEYSAKIGNRYNSIDYKSQW